MASRPYLSKQVAVVKLAHKTLGILSPTYKPAVTTAIQLVIRPIDIRVYVVHNIQRDFRN